MGIDIDVIPYVEQHGIGMAPFGSFNLGRGYVRNLIYRIPDQAKGNTPEIFFLRSELDQAPYVMSNRDMYDSIMRSVPLRNLVSYFWKNITGVKADGEQALFRRLFAIENERPRMCRAAFFWW